MTVVPKLVPSNGLPPPEPAPPTVWAAESPEPVGVEPSMMRPPGAVVLTPGVWMTRVLEMIRVADVTVATGGSDCGGGRELAGCVCRRFALLDEANAMFLHSAGRP